MFPTIVTFGRDQLIHRTNISDSPDYIMDVLSNTPQSTPFLHRKQMVMFGINTNTYSKIASISSAKRFLKDNTILFLLNVPQH